MKHVKKRIVFFYALFIGLGVFLLSAQQSFSNNSNQVHMIQLEDDTINPVTAEYIEQSIDRAVEEQAQCLIIKMDTPGGLLTSTRSIVKKMLVSKVPIVVYVGPSGSRAGSAGVFITYASHIAAMAPSTNIGAAHPVKMGEAPSPREGDWKELRDIIEEVKGLKDKYLDAQKSKEENRKEIKKEKDAVKDETNKGEVLEADQNPMESKILQDTVAFIKAIAKERNRNIEWGVDSVVKSSSITSEEALAKGVVEIIAKSDRDLLEQLDGRTIMVQGKEIVLKTKEASVLKVAMDARQRFFNVLANPNIAYFLMIFGFYGLLFEVTHPGFGVPGILGIVFLILAFYSMQTLPTDYAGLALMILGLCLFVAEAYTPTFGVLTLGGAVCLVLGSMLLFKSVSPVMQVSKMVIYSFTLTTAGITLFLVRSVLRSHRARISSGKEGLIGYVGETQTPFKAGEKGKVFMHGELWNAVSDEDIEKGKDVVVEEVNGLTLKIKKKLTKE